MNINTDNANVWAVPSTVNKTNDSLQLTADNTDALLQLRWTDDKTVASVQLTYMINMTAMKPCLLWKPRPVWANKEANHKDVNDL